VLASRLKFRKKRGKVRSFSLIFLICLYLSGLLSIACQACWSSRYCFMGVCPCVCVLLYAYKWQKLL